MVSKSLGNGANLLDRVLRACPVCGSNSEVAHPFLSERIDPTQLNEFSFSSRKEPEFFNYRMVRCGACDVVYVDQPPSQQALAHAYHVAEYDSAEEANDAAAAYIRELEPILCRLPHKGAALEIGTGTGVFLERLSEKGFERVVGIEPSTAAISAAPPHRRSWIREGIFIEADYAPESFELICCFMTLEHVREPREIAESVLRLLKPGGVFVAVTHDYRSAVNRVLGRRSPIIDVEHMQLFSSNSVRALFERSGYFDVEVKPFSNRYALSYWMRLLPVSSGFKQAAARMLDRVGLSRQKISVNVGNMIVFGVKPNNRLGLTA